MHAEAALSAQWSRVEEWPGTRLGRPMGPHCRLHWASFLHRGLHASGVHCGLTLGFKVGNYVVMSVVLEPTGHRR